MNKPNLISAKTGENLDLLLRRIEEMLNYDIEYNITLPEDKNYMSLLSFIYDYGDIIQLKVNGDINIKFRINSKFLGEIERLINYFNQ